ncbi:MAG TPA: DUF992 domain-containing protein [Paracoccaceae bacterium]|nr:DUF992 domain-containing protein [Paracoccaceae bacterium]
MKSMTIALGVAAALVAGSAMAEDAGVMAEDAGVEIGQLTCKATGTTNAILFTDTHFDCKFASAGGSKPVEHYRGEIKEIGVNLSIKDEVTLIWAVLAPTRTKYLQGQLAGNYVGAGADASIVVGGGANVLIGGGNNGFQLQPISVEGIKGTGVSLGIERLRLDAVPG